ncbi:hypothetical protein LFL96_21005 [Paraburkholderia sp. D15]|uniref:hypothetical protein n=1 Tax=Paraburkholderia sp. D15 TaxID=2880218 RepID=UPI002479959E|nr:hypothetical protein [Paraburkholderia sp. D15]WGS53540.1 hypothetical protein LFL96_21005 [Paraburkholderia sp. D15]
MGKHANAEIYRQFERRADRGLDESMDDADAPLTEAERAAEWDDAYWERQDAQALPPRVVLSDELHAPGVRRVRLGDV